MQQMAIDVKEVGVLTHTSDDMLVPDLGQHRAARLSQCNPPFGFSRPATSVADRRFARLLVKAFSLHQSMPDSRGARADLATRHVSIVAPVALAVMSGSLRGGLTTHVCLAEHSGLCEQRDAGIVIAKCIAQDIPRVLTQ